MKQLSYLFLGLGAFLLSSCSQEDVFDPTLSGGESTVTFTIEAPKDIQSRAFADGTTAENLQYAVYKKNSDGEFEKITEPGYSGKVSDFHITTTLSFQLLNNETYKLVLVADKFGKTSNGAYYVSFGTKTATLGSTSMYSGSLKDEAADVFYAAEEFTVTGPLNGTILLKRAVAQINIGTNDYEKAEALGFKNLTSASISVRSYMTLNLMTGKGGTLWNVDKAYNSSAYELKDVEAFPVEGNKYMAMAYVIVGDEQENFDITFKFNYEKTDGTKVSGETRTISSVPLQRNRRTNIYGSILTSTADFNITIDDEFGTPDLEADPFMVALATGGSGSLNSDLTITKQKDVKNTSVVDLNGNTITSNIKTSSTNNQSVPIYVTSGGNLTIKGDAEGSKMFASAEYDSHLVGVGNGGTLTIESGTFEAEKDGEVIYIGNGGGTVYIKGGVFKNGNSGSSSQNFLLNCLDEEYKNGTAKFVITGGSFYNFDPSHSTVDINPNANWVPEGYAVIKTPVEGSSVDYWYTVVPKDFDALVSSTSELASMLESNPNQTIMLSPGVYDDGFKTLMGANSDFKYLTENSVILGYGSTLKNFTTLQFLAYQGNRTNYKGATVKGLTFENTTPQCSIFCGEFYDCSFMDGINTESGKYESNFTNCKFICENTSKMAFHNGDIQTDITLNGCTIDGRCDFGLNGGSLTFENCTLKIKGSEWGVYGTNGSITFKNCKIEEGSQDMIKSKNGIAINWQ